MRTQVSQRESADEGVDRSELQVQHCITPSGATPSVFPLDLVFFHFI